MEYQTYPCEVKLRYLVLRKYAVLAGFNSEGSAAECARPVGGTVWNAEQNPRKAGRDPKFSGREKDAIKEEISKGTPLRSIAKEFKCSVGYVHKLKCEHSRESGSN